MRPSPARQAEVSRIRWRGFIAGTPACRTKASDMNLRTRRAAVVAADMGAMLTEAPDVNIQQYMTEQYGQQPYPVYLVLKDGRLVEDRPVGG